MITKELSMSAFPQTQVPTIKLFDSKSLVIFHIKTHGIVQHLSVSDQHISLLIMSSRSIQVWHISFFFKAANYFFVWVYYIFCAHLSVYRNFRELSLGQCEQCCNEHGSAYNSSRAQSQYFRTSNQKWDCCFLWQLHF